MGMALPLRISRLLHARKAAAAAAAADAASPADNAASDASAPREIVQHRPHQRFAPLKQTKYPVRRTKHFTGTSAVSSTPVNMHSNAKPFHGRVQRSGAAVTCKGAIRGFTQFLTLNGMTLTFQIMSPSGVSFRRSPRSTVLYQRDSLLVCLPIVSSTTSFAFVGID